MDVTVGKFLRLLVVVFILIILGWLLFTLSKIITIIIVSSLIAYILDPIASYFEAKGLSRLNGTVIIFILVFLLFGLGIWLVIPGLFDEVTSLQNNLNAEKANDLIHMVESFIEKNIRFLNVETLNLQAKLNTLVTTLADELLSLLANAISLISVVVIIPFVVFFLLKDGKHMKKIFISYIPNRYFEMTLNVLHKMDHQLGGYLRGQFIESSVVGILAVIALWSLNVPYSTVIGVFAGLANMIPYVGPVAGMIPAILVTLVNGAEALRIIYIVGAFAIIQLIDNAFLQPIVLSRTVNLHPLIIIFAVLIGSQFFGLLGMLLAVPVAGIIKVTSSELYNGLKKFNVA